MQWCDYCEKWYNQDAPHECSERMVRENQDKLESWLGKFKVKDS